MFEELLENNPHKSLDEIQRDNFNYTFKQSLKEINDYLNNIPLHRLDEINERFQNKSATLFDNTELIQKNLDLIRNSFDKEQSLTGFTKVKYRVSDADTGYINGREAVRWNNFLNIPIDAAEISHGNNPVLPLTKQGQRAVVARLLGKPIEFVTDEDIFNFGKYAAVEIYNTLAYKSKDVNDFYKIRPYNSLSGNEWLSQYEDLKNKPDLDVYVRRIGKDAYGRTLADFRNDKGVNLNLVLATNSNMNMAATSSNINKFYNLQHDIVEANKYFVPYNDKSNVLTDMFALYGATWVNLAANVIDMLHIPDGMAALAQASPKYTTLMNLFKSIQQYSNLSFGEMASVEAKRMFGMSPQESARINQKMFDTMQETGKAYDRGDWYGVLKSFINPSLVPYVFAESLPYIISMSYGTAGARTLLCKAGTDLTSSFGETSLGKLGSWLTKQALNKNSNWFTRGFNDFIMTTLGSSYTTAISQVATDVYNHKENTGEDMTPGQFLFTLVSESIGCGLESLGFLSLFNKFIRKVRNGKLSTRLEDGVNLNTSNFIKDMSKDLLKAGGSEVIGEMFQEYTQELIQDFNQKIHTEGFIDSTDKFLRYVGETSSIKRFIEIASTVAPTALYTSAAVNVVPSSRTHDMAKKEFIADILKQKLMNNISNDFSGEMKQQVDTFKDIYSHITEVYSLTEKSQRNEEATVYEIVNTYTNSVNNETMPLNPQIQNSLLLGAILKLAEINVGKKSSEETITKEVNRIFQLILPRIAEVNKEINKNEDQRQPLIEHPELLSNALWKSAIAVSLGFDAFVESEENSNDFDNFTEFLNEDTEKDKGIDNDKVVSDEEQAQPQSTPTPQTTEQDKVNDITKLRRRKGMKGIIKAFEKMFGMTLPEDVLASICMQLGTFQEVFNEVKDKSLEETIDILDKVDVNFNDDIEAYISAIKSDSISQSKKIIAVKLLTDLLDIQANKLNTLNELLEEANTNENVYFKHVYPKGNKNAVPVLTWNISSLMGIKPGARLLWYSIYNELNNAIELIESDLILKRQVADALILNNDAQFKSLDEIKNILAKNYTYKTQMILSRRASLQVNDRNENPSNDDNVEENTDTEVNSKSDENLTVGNNVPNRQTINKTVVQQQKAKPNKTKQNTVTQKNDDNLTPEEYINKVVQSGFVQALANNATEMEDDTGFIELLQKNRALPLAIKPFIDRLQKYINDNEITFNELVKLVEDRCKALGVTKSLIGLIKSAYFPPQNGKSYLEIMMENYSAYNELEMLYKLHYLFNTYWFNSEPEKLLADFIKSDKNIIDTLKDTSSTLYTNTIDLNNKLQAYRKQIYDLENKLSSYKGNYNEGYKEVQKELEKLLKIAQSFVHKIVNNYNEIQNFLQYNKALNLSNEEIIEYFSEDLNKFISETVNPGDEDYPGIYKKVINAYKVYASFLQSIIYDITEEDLRKLFNINDLNKEIYYSTLHDVKNYKPVSITLEKSYPISIINAVLDIQNKKHNNTLDWIAKSEETQNNLLALLKNVNENFFNTDKIVSKRDKRSILISDKKAKKNKFLTKILNVLSSDDNIKVTKKSWKIEEFKQEFSTPDKTAELIASTYIYDYTINKTTITRSLNKEKAKILLSSAYITLNSPEYATVLHPNNESEACEAWGIEPNLLYGFGPKLVEFSRNNGIPLSKVSNIIGEKAFSAFGYEINREAATNALDGLIKSQLGSLAIEIMSSSSFKMPLMPNEDTVTDEAKPFLLVSNTSRNITQENVFNALNVTRADKVVKINPEFYSAYSTKSSLLTEEIDDSGSIINIKAESLVDGDSRIDKLIIKTKNSLYDWLYPTEPTSLYAEEKSVFDPSVIDDVPGNFSKEHTGGYDADSVDDLVRNTNLKLNDYQKEFLARACNVAFTIQDKVAELITKYLLDTKSAQSKFVTQYQNANVIYIYDIESARKKGTRGVNAKYADVVQLSLDTYKKNKNGELIKKDTKTYWFKAKDDYEVVEKFDNGNDNPIYKEYINREATNNFSNKNVLTQLMDKFNQDGVLVVGHNIKDFDNIILKQNTGLDIKEENVLDTLEAARIFRDNNNRLIDLFAEAKPGMTLKGISHQSDTDIKMNKYVLEYLIAKLENSYTPSEIQEKFLKSLGWTDYNNLAKMYNSIAIAKKGKNQAIKKELLGLFAATKAHNLGYNFFVNRFFGKNNRLYYEGILDPQSNKIFQRSLIVPERYVGRTYYYSDEIGDCVISSLFYTSDKKEIERLKEELTNMSEEDFMTLWLTNDKKSLANHFKAERVDSRGSLLQAWCMFQEVKESNGKSFKTAVSVEFDGRTSGIAIKIAQLGSEKDLNKIGGLVGLKTRDNEDKSDPYMFIAEKLENLLDIDKILADSAKAKQLTPIGIDLINAIRQSFQKGNSFDIWALREFVKPPTMTTSYTAGLKATMANMVSVLLNDKKWLEHFHEWVISDNKPEKDAIVSFISNIAKRYNVTDERFDEFLKKHRIEELRTKDTNKYIMEDIIEIFQNTIGKDIFDTIEETYGFKEYNSFALNASDIAYKNYRKFIKEELDRLAKKYGGYYAIPGKEMIKLDNFMKDNTIIPGSKSISPSLNPTVVYSAFETDLYLLPKTNTDLGEVGVPFTVYDNPGNAGAVDLIHLLDSLVFMNFSEQNYDLVGIFDAIEIPFISMNFVKGRIKTFNQAFFKIMYNINIMDIVSKNAKQAIYMAFLNKYPQYKKSTRDDLTAEEQEAYTKERLEAYDDFLETPLDLRNFTKTTYKEFLNDLENYKDKLVEQKKITFGLTDENNNYIPGEVTNINNVVSNRFLSEMFKTSYDIDEGNSTSVTFLFNETIIKPVRTGKKYIDRAKSNKQAHINMFKSLAKNCDPEWVKTVLDTVNQIDDRFFVGLEVVEGNVSAIDLNKEGLGTRIYLDEANAVKYAHELFHPFTYVATNDVFTAGEQNRINTLKTIKERVREALIKKYGEDQAKKLSNWNSMFEATEDIQIQEFLDNAMANPVIMKELKALKLPKRKSVFDLVRDIFIALIKMVTLRAKFDDVCKVYNEYLNGYRIPRHIDNYYDAVKGIMDELYKLRCMPVKENKNIIHYLQNVANAKNLFERKFVRKMDNLMDLNDWWDGRKTGKPRYDIVNAAEEINKIFSSKNKNKGLILTSFLKNMAYFASSKEARRNFNYLLNHAEWYTRKYNWYSNILFDMIGDHGDYKSVERFIFLRALNETKAKEIDVSEYKVLQDAFNSHKVTKEEATVLYKLMRHDVQSLYNTYSNNNDILQLISNDDYRHKELEIMKANIEANLKSEHFKDLFHTTATYMSYFLRTGKSAMGYFTNARQPSNSYFSSKLIKGVSTENYVNAYFTLLSLDAFTDKDLLRAMLQDKDCRNGISIFLQHHNNFVKVDTSSNNLRVLNTRTKGYTKLITDGSKDIFIGEISKEKELAALGYEVVGKYQDEAGKYFQVYARNILAGQRRVSSSAFAVGGEQNSIKDVTHSIFEMLGFNALSKKERNKKVHEYLSDMSKKSTENISKALEAYRKGELNDEWLSKHTGSFITQFDSAGKIQNYYINIDDDIRTKYMDISTNGLEVLSSMYSNMYRKQGSKDINKQLMDFLYDDFADNAVQSNDGKYYYVKGNKASKYVSLSKDSSNERIRKMFDVLPLSIKESLKDKPLMVRQDWVLQLFGNDIETIVNLKIFNNHVTAQKVAAFCEQIMKLITSLAKQKILFNIPTVLSSNVVSNIFLSYCTGHNLIDILKAYPEAIKATKGYIEDRQKLAYLKQKGITDKNTARLIRFYENKVSKNYLNDLFNENFFSSVTQDIGVASSDEIDIAPIMKEIRNLKLSKKAATLSPTAKNVINNIWMGKGSVLYNTLYKATELSDFIARAVDYQLEMGKLPNKGEKGYSAQYAKLIQGIRYRYVNYDLPSSDIEDYANRVGILMFTKFRKRIQSIVFHGIKGYPIRALESLAVSTHIPLNFDTPITDTVFFHPFPFSNLYANPVDLAIKGLTPGLFHLME